MPLNLSKAENHSNQEIHKIEKLTKHANPSLEKLQLLKRTKYYSIKYF